MCILGMVHSKILPGEAKLCLKAKYLGRITISSLDLWYLRTPESQILLSMTLSTMVIFNVRLFFSSHVAYVGCLKIVIVIAWIWHV